VKDLFKKIDVNNDGNITLQELDACLSDANNSPSVISDLQNLREGLRLSGEDSLKWRDFIAMTMDRNLAFQEDNLEMVFEHFKSSGRDHLVISDIVDLVGGSEKQAMEIMKMVDENSDGRIDFSEFRKMMQEEKI